MSRETNATPGNLLMKIESFSSFSSSEDINVSEVGGTHDSDKTRREWTIPNLSKLGDVWSSEEFSVENYKWKVNLHPKGVVSLAKGSCYMSLFLEPKGFPPHRRVKAEVSMRILIIGLTASGVEQGFPEFIKIDDMYGCRRLPSSRLLFCGC
ncbi:hypothetical protein SASPL_113257 [Salvia splendens]|uniref:MATH domain-containing protein n=1 Tax=Salvia splendens TaxID=180675 RepID=A0A8X8XZP3_SALSN|nr:hypothetical protein SASPL_113257 [Salvia splendens]